MKRVELDEADIPTPGAKLGTAESIPAEHAGHTYLYIPDLSSQTKWGAHAVPMKEPERDRHPLGFRRR